MMETTEIRTAGRRDTGQRSIVATLINMRSTTNSKIATIIPTIHTSMAASG
jgi:hypothetical protein